MNQGIATIVIYITILPLLVRKGLKPHVDAERYDKSKTNLEGNVLVQYQHSGRPDPRAALRALHSDLDDPLVDTRPRTPLSVGLVYLQRISQCWQCRRRETGVRPLLARPYLVPRQSTRPCTGTGRAGCAG